MNPEAFLKLVSDYGSARAAAVISAHPDDMDKSMALYGQIVDVVNSGAVSA
ncbi:hypothetical protein [Plantibacter sp. YIM 135249]|uniref:hypothetical protein n=1 Tax=Plantibacter sp. YIM 135249 TaxID=3423918 RepID=UPI003D3321C1